MKKTGVTCFWIFLLLLLVSWGETGHRAIGQIAENHLSPQAKADVSELLGGKSLADVSTYADEIKSDPNYRYTAPWHYINVPPGLSYEGFRDFVLHDRQPNIYNNLIIDILYLKNPGTIKLSAGKIKGFESHLVKMIVHLVGDMHQPMHVSREEDKGGNNIAVKFGGYYTDLHSLWDYGLLDRQKLSFQQIAKDYDTATPVQINKWQHDSIMIWLYESYQISTILYAEAENDNRFDETYYESHLPVLKRRIERAGIRLAAVLNYCFSSDGASQLLTQ
jgi:hypothetical protein